MPASQHCTLRERCSKMVENLGLAPAESVGEVRPLTGGVASDIASVEIGERVYCVKFPLEKFKVAEDWRAPLGRNAAEYAWLKFAGETVPGAAPQLYGRDPTLNGFVMDFLAGDDIYLWKSALLDRQPPRAEAHRVGTALGKIHAASASAEFSALPFQNQEDFQDLRLDPYLLYTGSIHGDLAKVLAGLVDSLRQNPHVLIHGDVSPKNILIHDGQPVFLDAECATMGDPCFDIAFCLNHLMLKAFHMPDQASVLAGEAAAFWLAYSVQVDWEDARDLETRTCALLPALMLARVDGKSPVEYLDSDTRNRVRAFARSFVLQPSASLVDFVAAVEEQAVNG